MHREILNPYATPLSDVGDEGLADYADVKILSFKGRLGRARYMAYMLSLFLIVWLGGGLITALTISTLRDQDPVGFGAGIVIVMAVVYGSLFVGLFTLTVRRINDFGYSGWLSLLLLVPFVNVLLFLLLWILPGSKGVNRYGPPPPGNGGGVIFMAVLLPIMLLAVISMIAAIAIPQYQMYMEMSSQIQAQ